MKKKDLKSLRTKEKKEILKTLEKKRKSLSESWIKTKAGQEKNTKKVKMLRKDIAQILTILKEKETGKKEKPKIERKNK